MPVSRLSLSVLLTADVCLQYSSEVLSDCLLLYVCEALVSTRFFPDTWCIPLGVNLFLLATVHTTVLYVCGTIMASFFVAVFAYTLFCMW